MTVTESRISTLPKRVRAVQSSPGVKVITAQGSNIQPVRRLIVLVPNEDMDEAQIARKIWEMAFDPKAAVLLLCLCTNDSEEYQIQRRLITLAALIQHPRISVETHIAYGRNWLRGLKAVLNDGDVIVCHEEQFVGWRQQPLVDVLGGMNVPVWTLSGILPIRLRTQLHWPVSAVFWLGAVAILALFFYFQMQVNTLQDELTKNVFLILSILVELASLYQWNSIF